MVDQTSESIGLFDVFILALLFYTHRVSPKFFILNAASEILISFMSSGFVVAAGASHCRKISRHL